jgi:hypothetical protein
MWFKTKSGFLHVDGMFEIIQTRLTNHKTQDGSIKNTLGIYAYRYVHAQGVFRLFGQNLSVYNRSTYFAFFPDTPEGQEMAAKCLLHIESAIQAKEDLCDLSEFGSASDWTEGFTLIHWPKKAADV